MAWRKIPSAMGLRQTLPVHTNRIVFIKSMERKWVWWVKSSILNTREAAASGAALPHHGQAFQQIQGAGQCGIAYYGHLQFRRALCRFFVQVHAGFAFAHEFGFVETRAARLV